MFWSLVLDCSEISLSQAVARRWQREGEVLAPPVVLKPSQEELALLQEELEQALLHELQNLSQTLTRRPDWSLERLAVVAVLWLESAPAARRSLLIVRALLEALGRARQQPAFAALLRGMSLSLLVPLPCQPVKEEQHQAQLGAFFQELQWLTSDFATVAGEAIHLEHVALVHPGNYHQEHNPSGYPNVAQPDRALQQELLSELAFALVEGRTIKAARESLSPDQRGPFWLGAASLSWDGRGQAKKQAAARLAELCAAYQQRKVVLAKPEVEKLLPTWQLDAVSLVHCLQFPKGAREGGVFAEVLLDEKDFARPAKFSSWAWNLELPLKVLLAQDYLEEHQLPHALRLVQGEAESQVEAGQREVVSFLDELLGVPGSWREPLPAPSLPQAKAGLQWLREAFRAAEKQKESNFPAELAIPKPYGQGKLRRLAPEVPEQPKLGKYWQRHQDLVQHQPLPWAAVTQFGVETAGLAAVVVLGGAKLGWWELIAGGVMDPKAFWAFSGSLLLGALLGFGWHLLWQWRITQARARLLVAIAKLYGFRVKEEILQAYSRVYAKLVGLLDELEKKLKAWEQEVSEAQQRLDRSRATQETAGASHFCLEISTPPNSGFGNWEGTFIPEKELDELLRQGWARRWKDQSQPRPEDEKWIVWLVERGYRYLAQATTKEILERYPEEQRRQWAQQMQQRSFPFCPPEALVGSNVAAALAFPQDPDRAGLLPDLPSSLPVVNSQVSSVLLVQLVPQLECSRWIQSCVMAYHQWRATKPEEAQAMWAWPEHAAVHTSTPHEGGGEPLV